LSLQSQNGIEDGSGSPAFDRLEASAEAHLTIFGAGALLALGADQHIEGLHQSVARAGVIVVQQRFGDQQGAPEWKRLVYSSEEAIALVEIPIVENPTDRVEIRGRKIVGEEVAGLERDSVSNRRFGDTLAGQIADGRQIEDCRAERSISFAGGYGEVTGRAAKIDQVPKAGEVEGANDSL
jgi:hypothetical protein